MKILNFLFVAITLQLIALKTLEASNTLHNGPHLQIPEEFRDLLQHGEKYALKYFLMIDDTIRKTLKDSKIHSDPALRKRLVKDIENFILNDFPKTFKDIINAVGKKLLEEEKIFLQWYDKYFKNAKTSDERMQAIGLYFMGMEYLHPSKKSS